MDKETYELVFTKYKNAESGSKEKAQALEELMEVLKVQQLYDVVYAEQPTGLQALLQNSDLVGFGRDVIVSVLVLKYEQMNIFTSRVGSFVRLNRK